jgi:large subunit ribosomal protein L18
METAQKRLARSRRHGRVRKRVTGTAERPRLAVFRSSKHIYAQVIDDSTGRTMAAASSLEADLPKDNKEAARGVGHRIAAKAKDAGVTRVTFDRGGYKYHGRVQAVADGAREKGLEL